eukprot:5700297-Ditylum_brightwellii.AAC.1
MHSYKCGSDMKGHGYFNQLGKNYKYLCNAEVNCLQEKQKLSDKWALMQFPKRSNTSLSQCCKCYIGKDTMIFIGIYKNHTLLLGENDVTIGSFCFRKLIGAVAGFVGKSPDGNSSSLVVPNMFMNI